MSQAFGLSPSYPIYRELSAALHDTFHVSSSPSVIPAREHERSIITQFIMSALPQSHLERISQHEHPMYAETASAVLNGTPFPTKDASLPSTPSPSPSLSSPEPSTRRLSHTPSSSTPFNLSMAASHGKALYITGTPGTGKTLTVTRIIDELGLRDCKDVSVLQMNAMGKGDGYSVFQALHHQLTGEQPRMSANNKKQASKQMGDRFANLCYDPDAFDRKCPSYAFDTPGTSNFTPSQDFGDVRRPTRTIIAVVDEIDALLAKDTATLHRLFSLPYQQHSKLWLIAIANSINLADVTLAQASHGSVAKPSVIVFQRYGRDGLLDILKGRLTQAAGVITKWCLKHCKKKESVDVGASSDIALQVCEEGVNVALLRSDGDVNVSVGVNAEDVGKQEMKEDSSTQDTGKASGKRSRKEVSPDEDEEEEEEVEVRRSKRRTVTTRATPARTRTRRGAARQADKEEVEEEAKQEYEVVPEKQKSNVAVEEKKGENKVGDEVKIAATPVLLPVDDGLTITPEILTLPSIPVIISRLIQTPAIIMCSRQVATHNGDVRLLLDITRQALTAVGLLHVASINLYYLICEATNVLQLEEPAPLNIEMREQRPVPGTSLITIKHIMDVISTKFVPPKMKLMQSLPTQQQLVLCSAVVTQVSRAQSSTSSELNYELLQKCSNVLLKSMSLPEVAREAFALAFDALETNGFFHVKKIVNNKRFFTINVSYDDVSFALRNIPIFQTLFNKTDAKLNK